MTFLCLFGPAYFLFAFFRKRKTSLNETHQMYFPNITNGTKKQYKVAYIPYYSRVAPILLACPYIVRCLGLHWLNLGFCSFSNSPSIDSWQIVSKSCWEYFAISYGRICSLVHDPPKSVTRIPLHRWVFTQITLYSSKLIGISENLGLFL